MARNAKQGHPRRGGPARKNVRRRPTLPQPLGCSTIGAERLNFRVRDGTGCFPFAMAAVTLVVAPRCCHWVAKHVCVQLLVHTPLVPVFAGCWVCGGCGREQSLFVCAVHFGKCVCSGC